MRGGAGHGQLPAAGRGVFHRFSDGEREGGRFDLLRPCPGELAALYDDRRIMEQNIIIHDLDWVGKFQLAAVGGVTKKGRTAIVVKRYI